MPHWDAKLFEKHAGEIVGAWASTRDQGGASLNALVEKTARDHALNPEQIRRLCRVTNGKAFNETFARMAKAGADRVVDFDTAKEDHVIGELHKTAALSRVKAAAFYPPLEDELASTRPEPPELFSKQAYELRQNEARLEAVLGRDQSKPEKLLHLKKVAEELRGRRALAGYKYRDAIDKLAAAQRVVGHDRDRFERDALAVCGPDAVGVVNALRDRLKVARLEIPAGKVAAFLDRLVGEETPLTALVKQAVQAADDCASLTVAAAEVESDLAVLRREVVGG